jgi:hypothetical protein
VDGRRSRHVANDPTASRDFAGDLIAPSIDSISEQGFHRETGAIASRPGSARLHALLLEDLLMPFGKRASIYLRRPSGAELQRKRPRR